MGATSLTGLPFIFAAFSGVGASVLAAVIGKRSIYVVGGVLMLVGALWNMHAGSFAQFMASRLFQGIGWGMTESLVTESIRDIFFVGTNNSNLLTKPILTNG
jgi:MFS family permease